MTACTHVGELAEEVELVLEEHDLLLAVVEVVLLVDELVQRLPRRRVVRRQVDHVRLSVHVLAALRQVARVVLLSM